MKKIIIIFAILFAAIFASDPVHYTTGSPPTSIPNDSIVFYRADPVVMGRLRLPSDEQQMFHSLINRIDSTFYADSTGIFTFDKSRLLYFVGDTVYMRYLVVDSMGTDDNSAATKSYVDNHAGTVNDTLTGEECSESVGALVYYADGPDEWFDCTNTNETTCKGLIGFYHGSGKIQISGIFTTSGLNKGKDYYIGTAGSITATVPDSATADVVRKIGDAKSSTELRFNPSKDYGVYK